MQNTKIDKQEKQLMNLENDPTKLPIYVPRSNRMLMRHNFLDEAMDLTLTARKVLDYSLSTIDPITLTSVLDIEEMVDDMLADKPVKDSRQRASYRKMLIDGVKELRDKSVEVALPDPTDPNTVYWVSVSWVSRYIRKEKLDTKTPKKLILEFDPIVAPNIIMLQENKHSFNRRLPVKFRSDYAYLLYPLLLAKEQLGTFIYTLEDLMLAMNVAPTKFSRNSDLIKWMVKVPVDEINKKSDIYVTMEMIKEGRKIVAIEFTVIRKYGEPPIEAEKASVLLEQSEDQQILANINAIKKQISYEEIANEIAEEKLECFASHLNVILDCMYEVLYEPRDNYTINGTRNFPIAKLQAAYQEIGKTEVIYALRMVYNRLPEMKSVNAYYCAVLYNAPAQAKATVELELAQKNKNFETDQNGIIKRKLDSDEIAAIRRMINDPNYDLPQE